MKKTLLYFILRPNTQALVARNYHPPFLNFLFTYKNSAFIVVLHSCCVLKCYAFSFKVHKLVSYFILRPNTQALVARNYHPPFLNFLFTYLFSIKFLYFFIISFLFPYFNLFVSIFIQPYANIKLHVSSFSLKLNSGSCF
jgi:hypothetical protein